MLRVLLGSHLTRLNHAQQQLPKPQNSDAKLQTHFFCVSSIAALMQPFKSKGVARQPHFDGGHSSVMIIPASSDGIAW